MLKCKGYKEGCEIGEGEMPWKGGWGLSQTWREAGEDVSLRLQKLLNGLAYSS